MYASALWAHVQEAIQVDGLAIEDAAANDVMHQLAVITSQFPALLGNTSITSICKLLNSEKMAHCVYAQSNRRVGGRPRHTSPMDSTP